MGIDPYYVFIVVSIVARCGEALWELDDCRTIVCGVVEISNQLDDKLEGPVHDLIRFEYMIYILFRGYTISCLEYLPPPFLNYPIYFSTFQWCRGRLPVRIGRWRKFNGFIREAIKHCDGLSFFIDVQRYRSHYKKSLCKGA